MREFFHGWRRKAGVVTLVMACVFAGMWVRSEFLVDSINIEIGPQLYIIWSAPDGCFFGLLDRLPAHLRGPDRQGFADFSWWARTPSEIAGQHPGHGSGSITDIVRAVRLAKPTDSFWVLYYCWIVLPLTLLSAYLILWKPRTKLKEQPNA